MKITERRIVFQDWYETDEHKTGWESSGWMFKDDCQGLVNDWDIVEHLKSDKFGNPILGIAEKGTEI
jgi:hypothetical protein